VSDEVIERLAAHLTSCGDVEAMGVDIVGDPHRETDQGYNSTRLSYARNIRDVTPGSAVVLGSSIGSYCGVPSPRSANVLATCSPNQVWSTPVASKTRSVAIRVLRVAKWSGPSRELGGAGWMPSSQLLVST
jgi:hypothetical protein